MESSGSTRWHKVRQALEEDIRSGALGPGAQLPSDPALAARFGVNKHTVRRAITEMHKDGFVRVERGKGTFVTEAPLSYVLCEKPSVTQNLLRSHRLASRNLLETFEMPAPNDVAQHLEIKPGEPVYGIFSTGQADGVTVTAGYAYYPVSRAPGILDAFSGENSVTKALKRIGIVSYRRLWTRIRARMPTEKEASLLQIPMTLPVFSNLNVDVTDDGKPLKLSDSAMRSDWYEFYLNTDEVLSVAKRQKAKKKGKK